MCACVSGNAPQLIESDVLGECFACQPQLLIQLEVGLFSLGILSCALLSNFVYFPLCSGLLFIPRVHNVNLVFLDRNGHFVQILLNVFVDGLHPEKGSHRVRLKQLVYLGEALFEFS